MAVMSETAISLNASAGAGGICRGARRLLWTEGQSSLTEFPLPNGRRADILSLCPTGEVTIVEVKSSVVDFRTDCKWPEYRDFCDRFFFAVDDLFPSELIPEGCGLIIADSFGAEIVRPSPVARLAGARRKSLVGAFARLAALRLHRIEDPMLGQF